MSDMNDMERWHAYGNENGDGPWNDDIDPGYEVGICQNCDAQLTLQQARRGKLFCSEKCQQTANTVRYGRATLLDGRYKRDPLVRQAIDIRIAIILGGGYPEKARALSPEQREAIFKRDGRRCRLCGAPATDIDHIAGSSSDPENLQALCKPCNMAKARANFRSATPEEAAEGNAIWARIRAERPVRLCDDEKKWDELWREIASEQRKFAPPWTERTSEANGNH
jgi:5-methylcytosine-specific restriction endonuclease McrA